MIPISIGTWFWVQVQIASETNKFQSEQELPQHIPNLTPTFHITSNDNDNIISKILQNRKENQVLNFILANFAKNLFPHAFIWVSYEYQNGSSQLWLWISNVQAYCICNNLSFGLVSALGAPYNLFIPNFSPMVENKMATDLNLLSISMMPS